MKIEELIKVALATNNDIYYTFFDCDSYQLDKRGIKVDLIVRRYQERDIKTIIIGWDTIHNILNNENIYKVI